MRRNLVSVLGEKVHGCPHPHTDPAHFSSKADLGQIWVARSLLLSERTEGRKQEAFTMSS